jgi:hypothetical protein
MLSTILTWLSLLSLSNFPANMRIAIFTLFGVALADTSSYVLLKHTNGNTVCSPPSGLTVIFIYKVAFFF